MIMVLRPPRIRAWVLSRRLCTWWMGCWLKRSGDLLKAFTRPVFLRKGTRSWQTILIHLRYLNKFDVVLMVVRHVISARTNQFRRVWSCLVKHRMVQWCIPNKAPKTTCDSESPEHEELKLFSSALPSSAASKLSILHTAPLIEAVYDWSCTREQSIQF